MDGAHGGDHGNPAAVQRPIPLTPAVDLLHCYQGLPSDVREVPLVLRQMVAHMVTVEGIRRAEEVRPSILNQSLHWIKQLCHGPVWRSRLWRWKGAESICSKVKYRVIMTDGGCNNNAATSGR